jgi:heptosyltransferase III
VESTRSAGKRKRPVNIHGRPIRSILVIKLRAIGDVLLSTIVTPNLRRAFPDARIDFLTEKAAEGIITGNPYINDAIVFSPKKDSSIRLFSRLFRARYDLVFDLFCNPRSAQLTFATQAPVRVGYPFRGRAWAYNVHVQTRADKVHNTQFNLDALRALDIPTPERRLVLSIPDNLHSRAAGFIADMRKRSGPVIALNSSGTWESKRWGLTHFAGLADALIDRFDANVLLMHGPGELADVEAISSSMRGDAIIPPPTTLKELAALFTNCDATISNDSGPMHISAATGTPTLGIFGPTNPLLQGPWDQRSSWIRLEGLDCLACNKTVCDIGNICMRDLSVESVFQAFLHMMEKNHER